MSDKRDLKGRDDNSDGVFNKNEQPKIGDTTAAKDTTKGTQQHIRPRNDPAGKTGGSAHHNKRNEYQWKSSSPPRRASLTTTVDTNDAIPAKPISPTPQLMRTVYPDRAFAEIGTQWKQSAPPTQKSGQETGHDQLTKPSQRIPQIVWVSPPSRSEDSAGSQGLQGVPALDHGKPEQLGHRIGSSSSRSNNAVVPSSPAAPHGQTLPKAHEQKSTVPVSTFNFTSTPGQARFFIPETIPNDHDVGASSKHREKERDGDEDDLQSIASSTDSISSAQPSDVFHGKAGLNYLLAKFAADEELLALYEAAGNRLTTPEFIENNSRLLRGMYMDINQEAHTASQKEAAAFLRPRERRRLISWSAFRMTFPEKRDRLELEKYKSEHWALNRYLSDLDNAESNIADPRPDHLDFDDNPTWGMINLQATARYLVTSQAFTIYKQRLRRFLRSDPQKSRFRTQKGGKASKHVPMDVEDPHMDVLDGRLRRITDASRKLAVSIEDPPRGQEKGASKKAESSRQDSQVQGQADHDVQRSLRPRQSQAPLHQDVNLAPESDSMALHLRKTIINAIWPPSNGCQRIWYQCGCGNHTYLDVMELRPGGANQLLHRIKKSAAAVRRRTTSTGDASFSQSTQPPPPSTHLTSPGSSNTASDSASVGASTLENVQSTTNPSSVSLPEDSAEKPPKFLLVCINGNNYKTLPELRYVDVSADLNDEQLLRGILQQYEEARQGNHWTMSLLIPSWIRTWSFTTYLQEARARFPNGIQRPTWLHDLSLTAWVPPWLSVVASEVGPWAPLHVLDTADFVRFHLIPRGEGKDPFPSQFKPGQWPTVDDVLTHRRYLYTPVPVVDAEILAMNLWHMRKDGPHTECFWYDVMPKKLNEGLFRPPGTRGHVYGYGIRINEKVNVLLVLSWSLIAMVITGIVTMVYALLTKDDSSAFGLGAYLTAILTLYISLQYEIWKRS